MKKLSALFLVFILLFALTGCAASRSRDDLPQSTRQLRTAVTVASAQTLAAYMAAPAAAAAPAADLTFRRTADDTIIFNVIHQAGQDHTYHLGLLVFQQEVADRTNGAIEVVIHHGGPGDVAQVNMLNANEVDGALITIWAAWAGFTDLANFESLPFVFSTYEEAWAAYEGALGRWVEENVVVPTGGGAVLSFFTNGLRHFTNNVRPITHPSDLTGLRMRSPQNPTHLSMYEAFGAASLAMALGPLFAALEDGSVDGQDNPIGTIYANRFYEVQQYVTLSYHMYSAAPLVMSYEFWNYITPAQQQALTQAALVAARYQGNLARDLEQDMIASMLAHGTNIQPINQQPFAQAVEHIWLDHINRFGNDFINIASQYISDPNSLAHRFATIPPPQQIVEQVEYEEYEEYENGEE